MTLSPRWCQLAMARTRTAHHTTPIESGGVGSAECGLAGAGGSLKSVDVPPGWGGPGKVALVHAAIRLVGCSCLFPMGSGLAGDASDLFLLSSFFFISFWRTADGLTMI
jgi:hypothetical protein